MAIPQLKTFLGGRNNEQLKQDDQVKADEANAAANPVIGATADNTLQSSLGGLRDIISGQDPFTQNITSRFQQSAAASKRAAEATTRQRAQQTGLSSAQTESLVGQNLRAATDAEAAGIGVIAQGVQARRADAESRIAQLEEKAETKSRTELSDWEANMDWKNQDDVDTWLELGKSVHGADWEPSYEDRQNAAWTTNKTVTGGALADHITANSSDYLDTAGNYSAFTEETLNRDTGDYSGAVTWNNPVVGSLMEDAYKADSKGNSLYINNNAKDGFTIDGEAWVEKQTKKFAQSESEAQWDSHLQTIESQYGTGSLEYNFAMDNKNVYASGIDPMYAELPDGGILLIDKNTGDTFGNTGVSRTDYGFDDETGFFWYNSGENERYAKTSTGKEYKYVTTTGTDGKEETMRYDVGPESRRGGETQENLENGVVVDSASIPGGKTGDEAILDPESTEFEAPEDVKDFETFEADGQEFINDPNFDKPVEFDSTYEITDANIGEWGKTEDQVAALSPEHQERIGEYFLENADTLSEVLKKRLLDNSKLRAIFNKSNALNYKLRVRDGVLYKQKYIGVTPFGAPLYGSYIDRQAEKF